MIKIIQYGTKQVRVCNTCGCKFTFDKEDVQKEKVDRYNCYDEFVECPQCKEKVALQTVR
jgi:uncharacterized protein with PIN domain